ncbi:hypothetical protein [Bradyrhizobium ottawaense]|uniref:hypothetical protein n=1 Tax=Bradyrhizobium ottawaense TaxID=931866 RepID=UPI0030F45534
MASDGQSNEKKPLLVWWGFGICVNCLAFSLMAGVLLLCVLFTGLHIPVGIEPLSLGEFLKLFYLSAAVPFLVLLGEILKGFSPWGFVVLGIVAVVLYGPIWIRKSLLSGRWKVGGFEYDGSTSSAFRKELNEAVKIVEQANEEIREAYESARPYASQLRERFQIGAAASGAAAEIARLVGPDCPDDFRLTIYVPDLLFSDRLYQFTEYYDKQGKLASEQQAGRTYSIRYGIIGRVWRSGVAEIEGELISPEDQMLLARDPRHGPIEKFIARRWGLTLAEAAHIKQYNSYAAIRLEIAESKVGVVFFYSKQLNAFGDNVARERALTEIKVMLEQSALVTKLLEINDEIASWSGRIQIFRNSKTGIV